MGYIDVSAQAMTFLMSVGVGAVFCLMYDFVRALHKLSINGFIEVLVCDLLFWGIAAFFTFCFLVIRCNGSVRGFVLVGELIGAVVTRFTLSRLFLPFLIKLFTVISKVFSFFGRGIGKVFKTLEKIIKKLLLKAKKVLQHKAILLYNYKRNQSKEKMGSNDSR